MEEENRRRNQEENAAESHDLGSGGRETPKDPEKMLNHILESNGVQLNY